MECSRRAAGHIPRTPADERALRTRPLSIALVSAASLCLVGGVCGGGGGGSGGSACDGSCPQEKLEVEDVERVIRQAVAEARVDGVPDATIAVVDRVGNVLAVYQMPAADPADFRTPTTQIRSNRATLTHPTQLEDVIVPAAVAAISKAGTAAYLSSQGNAFTTRTASQIIQEHFNPGESDRAGGPLFGVQFSQLPCGDLVGRFDEDAGRGPKRLPLGFAGDPGGLPLYKNGVPVGGVGVEFDGEYTIDLDILSVDTDLEERVATAATFGFEAPPDRRADRIAVDGRLLRFADDTRVSATRNDLAPFDPAGLVAVPGFNAMTAMARGSIQAGERFLDPESGVVAASNTMLGPHEVLVDSDGMNRYPATDSTEPPIGNPPVGLTMAEVTALLRESLGVAARARAQIRRPTGSAARVNIAVVDLGGNVLGFVRSPDAPVFGIDVSLQKARTARFLSTASAGSELIAAGAFPELKEGMLVPLADFPPLGLYTTETRTFLGDPNALTGLVAFSDRGMGNLARPFFPDGIDGRFNGPLSRPYDQWSPFSTGLQLDASLFGVVASICPIVPYLQDELSRVSGFPVGNCFPNPAEPSCICNRFPPLENPSGPLCTTPGALDAVANGFQIFAGSVPIYRGEMQIGGVGISGDGIDQDDLVAFLGLHDAGAQLSGSIGNAPTAVRSDTVTAQGVQLRYVSCPPSPFLGSDAQNVCDGK